MRVLLLMVTACSAVAADLPKVVFLEPVGKVDTAAAEIREDMPIYRQVADASKYEPWLHNESAERALRLYAQAARIAAPGASLPTRPKPAAFCAEPSSWASLSSTPPTPTARRLPSG